MLIDMVVLPAPYHPPSGGALLKSESFRYISHVLAGVALLCLYFFVALIAVQLPMAMPQRLAVLAALPMPCAYPLFRRLHRRSDEMLQPINYRACLFSMGLSFSVMTVAGLLQAANILPPVNALLGTLCLVMSWGLGLMLADRSMH